MKENKGTPQRQLLLHFLIFGPGGYMLIVVTVTKETGVTDWSEFHCECSIQEGSEHSQEDTKSAVEQDELSEKLRLSLFDSQMVFNATHLNKVT